MIHTESDVWNAAMDLVAVVYEVTNALPRDERFGLTAQMRRAASSIPSNIAEGAGRDTKREKRRFLIDARGSVTELETQFEICKRLKLLTPSEIEQVQPLVLRVRRLLAGTIRSLTTQMNPATRNS